MTRILLVEDNDDDIELTLIAFRRHNLANEIVVTRSGAEALHYLHAADAVLPTVVLLDLKLPRMDGTTVLRHIREHRATHFLPVVMLTSSSQERDRLATYSLGANSYIVKPVDFEQFVASAQQIGMYWLMLNAPPPQVERSDSAPAVS